MNNKQKKQLYIGIDLYDQYAMVSFIDENTDSPSTVNTGALHEEFSIPLSMCYLKESGNWSFGEEAERFFRAGMGEFYDNIFARAVKGEMTIAAGGSMSYSKLLTLFFRRLVDMCRNIIPDAEPAVLVVATEQLTIEVIETLNDVLDAMTDLKLSTHIMEHRECFYYYALSQPDELKRNNMALFDFTNEHLKAYILRRDVRSIPQRAAIEEVDFGTLNYSLDENFSEFIPQVLGKEIFSSVYLVGNGFDGGWLKESLKLLCRGRRAFQGKNLYSKGAGYAARVLSGREKWEYVYLGRHTMKFNVSLKVSDLGEMKFMTLVSAGERWFETKGECEVIIDGDNSIDFWVHMPDKRDAKIETFTLRGITERENRTTRIRIKAKPRSDHEVVIELAEVGFGEIAPSGNKKWEALIKV